MPGRMDATALDDLRTHATRLSDTSLPQLIADDPARARDFSLHAGPLYASFARQRIDRDALDALFALADAADIPAAIRALFDGVPVNSTEGRAALHTALRGELSTAAAATTAHAQAMQAQETMAMLVAGLEASDVTDIVSIGIGGSDLGPRLVVDALAPANPRFRVHFLSNVDGNAAQRVLAGLDPARTAAILISKTFSTQETLLNGTIVRDWLGNDRRLYAVSANVERAANFGIAAERILPMWDWVGGRYSLWSAVGFPIALAIGMQGFRQLLDGAAEFDAHALSAPPRDNLAIWHGLIAVWNRNALGASSHAVLCYDERLKLLPNYLQQLVMESLGKSVHEDGTPLSTKTVPVWWGGAGTDAQHSFFQALHQGNNTMSADFIGVVQADHGYADSHRALLANLLAQGEALANGQASDDPHRAYPGGRPSTTVLLDVLNAQSLGALLAMYEHSVFVQSRLWGINAFDQFGVELGKQVATRLLPALTGDAEADDPVTRELLAQLRKQP